MIIPGPSPYLSSGQELGETRSAMTKKLMEDLEMTINKYKDKTDKYYVLVHAKPFPKMQNLIKIKIVPMNIKPPFMLSCILFGVDNQSGKLTLEWALPGDWPTWAVDGKYDPVPEVIGSVSESGLRYYYDDLLPS